MTIHLGLTFANSPLPRPEPALGTAELDFTGLLRWLEGCYALAHPTTNRTALRSEQYRQLIEAHLAATTATPFYAASFAADKIATAGELLSRRDELLAAGYPLQQPAAAAVPDRIAVLHALEALVLDPDNELDLLPGEADRLNRLLAALGQRRHPVLTVLVHEPRPLLPPGLNRLLDRLTAIGDSVAQLPAPPPTRADSDLARWQRRLRDTLAGVADATPLEVAGDGSLSLIRAERETHIAAYLARMVRDNPDWRPGVLMTVRNQTLENAVLMEGLPSLGVPSTSLARPSLQVLKLVTAFLWRPLEVQRVMEFVSLVTKPLEARLGQRLAEYLADTPGMFGNRWSFTVEETFRSLRASGYSAARLRRARDQYNFWFERRRYDRDGRVPKAEVRSLFVYLRNWARDAFDEDNRQTGLRVLAAQAERATELLDTQPEADLGALDVERLVRTVYQPAPTQFRPVEAGALATAFAPASVVRFDPQRQPELRELVWWDFIERDPNYFFSRWYPPEVAYLAEAGVSVEDPQRRNELLVWQRMRPLLHVTDQLVLCVPQRVDGTEVDPHTLLGDLEAAFTADGLAALTVNIDLAGRAVPVATAQRAPTFAPVPIRPLAPPVPHLTIERPDRLLPREEETPTALEDLLYYPHKWVFRHQLRIKGTPILSIAAENRLRGNLSHQFVEELLAFIADEARSFAQSEVTGWIDDNWQRILNQRGAVLLEYGQEPERVQFLRTMKYSIWSLVDYIQKNGWQVKGSEQSVAGELAATQRVNGRADLILERTSTATGARELAVVDLKWRGKTVFKNLLRNAQDIQLCLYAEFLQREAEGATVHTAYYVLRDALLLSRNELAFANVETVATGEDFKDIQRATLRKIETTHNWRWEQLRAGQVEVRCRDTVPFLEDLYLDLDHDRLLEMKEEEARFDDYRSLIGLVR